MRSTLSRGTRVQYTHPPNGSFWGMPSASTSVRLTPLGPIPRSDTPCAVGCDDRLLVHRKSAGADDERGGPSWYPVKTEAAIGARHRLLVGARFGAHHDRGARDRAATRILDHASDRSLRQ